MRPQDTVEQALAHARRGGADGCVVLVEESSSVNLRWAGNTLTTNGVVRHRSVTVVAVLGGDPDTGEGAAAGVVTRNVADRSGLLALVDQAVAAAREAGPAEDAAPLVTGPADPQWAQGPEETSMAALAGLAAGLGDAFDRARAEQRELFGFAVHDVSTTYLGSSTGLRLRHVQPTGKVELTGKADGRASSAWAGVAVRDVSEVSVDALDAQVRQRLAWSRRRLDLPAGRYETVLPPSAVADLMVYLYWSAAARDAHEGRTVFSRPGGGTRVGERLAHLPLTLRSDPAAPGLQCPAYVLTAASSSAASVFDNGLPLSPTSWLDRGRLAALLQTRFSAALTGLPLTPPVDNLLLELPGADGSLTDLVGRTERGLLVTCLWYIREVDPQTLLLTGLTRDGVFLIEQGEVVGAVNNFRFNESPVGLLGRISEVGATEPTLPREWSDFFTRAAMPPVRVPDFNMSTVSAAQ